MKDDQDYSVDWICLIVFVGFVQEFLSIMHLRICLLEIVNGLEQLPVRSDIQLFLLALFLASKVEGKEQKIMVFLFEERLGVFSGRSRCWNWSVSAYYQSIIFDGGVSVRFRKRKHCAADNEFYFIYCSGGIRRAFIPWLFSIRCLDLVR